MGNTKHKKKVSKIPRKTYKPISKKAKYGIVIGFFALLIIGFFVGSYFLGKYRIAHYGSDTSDDAVRAYVSALADPNRIAFENCLCPYAKGYSQSVDSSLEIGKYFKDKVTIHPDSMIINTAPVSNISELTMTTQIPGITQVNVVQAQVQVTKPFEEETLDFTCLLTFTTVEINAKWFVIELDIGPLTDVAQLNEENYKLTWQGNDEFGYFLVPEGWTESYADDGNANTSYTYTVLEPNHTAAISTALYEPTKSVDAIVDELYNQFPYRDYLVGSPVISDMDINGYPTRVIVWQYEMEVGAKGPQYYTSVICLISTPMQDDKIRMLGINSTSDTINSYMVYLSTFTFQPQGIDSEKANPTTESTTES